MEQQFLIEILFVLFVSLLLLIIVHVYAFFNVDHFCFFCINAVSLPICTNTSQQILCM